MDWYLSSDEGERSNLLAASGLKILVEDAARGRGSQGAILLYRFTQPRPASWLFLGFVGVVFPTPPAHHKPYVGLVGFGGEQKTAFFPRNMTCFIPNIGHILSIIEGALATFCPFPGVL